MILRSSIRLLVVIGALTVSVTPVSAQDGDMERARARIEELSVAARRAKEQGRMDQAEALMNEARAVKERLAASRRDQPASDREHLVGIIEGLEQGMVALRKLGMEEEAAHLNQIADRVRERVRRAQREAPREQAARAERGAAQEQLEVMRLALPALLEGERHDAADLLEHAIHARELALEGRDDPEAMEVRRSSPPRGQVAEVLLMASRLWAEFGHETKARTIGELGRRFAERAPAPGDAPRAARQTDRPREDRGQPRADRPMTDRPPAPGAERLADLERRLDEMSQMMEHMGRMMEELERQLHEDRDR